MSETLGDVIASSLNREVGPIEVWPFHQAPAALRALSPHGGDEDWLAVVPKGFPGGVPFWMESGSRFGCCDTSEHVLLDGRTVCIGAHS